LLVFQALRDLPLKRFIDIFAQAKWWSQGANLPQTFDEIIQGIRPLQDLIKVGNIESCKSPPASWLLSRADLMMWRGVLPW
jgi:hypothetical protein